MLLTSKRAAIRKKQLKEEDPLVVMKIVEEDNLDLEYLEMLKNIENDTVTQDLQLESEIRQLLGNRSRMSVVTLEAGTRLIVKDESEILIPRKLRTQMMDILHYTHCRDEAMLRQCKRKIFWPGMRKDL